MIYEKERSYLSRLVETARNTTENLKGTARKGFLLGAMGLISYAGIDGLIEKFYPSAKSAQAQEQRDKTLIEKIKEYEAKGDKANADAQRKLLEQELLKTPQSLEGYLKFLSSSQEYITPETMLKAAKNAEPQILIATDKNAAVRAIESLYRMLLLKSGQTAAKNTQFELFLTEWQYANMLVDKGAAKYKADVSKAKAGITQAYSSMTAEEQAQAKKTAESYKLEFLVPAVPPKPTVPEAKPEPKKEEPKKPEVKPQPKTEPKKPRPAAKPQTPSAPAPEPESTEPNYAEIRTAINSNQTTKGNTNQASIITRFLDARGLYDFSEWQNPDSEMMTQSTTAGYISLKPLILAKAGEIFGIDVPKSIIDFLTIGGAFDSRITTRRDFDQSITDDYLFKIISDTAVKDRICDDAFAGNAAIRLAFLELAATGRIRKQNQKITVDNATYITNKGDPAGNHSTGTRTELENTLESQQIQAEINSLFNTELETVNDKLRFSGKAGLLFSQMKQRQKFADGTKQTIDDKWFGITGSGNLGNYLAFDAVLAIELFDGPGTADNGWKDTKAYLGILAGAPSRKVRNIRAQIINTPAFYTLVNGWINGKLAGAGAGAVLGTGTIKASHLENMLDTMGRTELGLRPDLGDTFSELEVERLMRTMPLAVRDGFNILLYAGVSTTLGPREKIDGATQPRRINAFGNAMLTAGPLRAIMVYKEEYQDEYKNGHFTRKIGGYAGVDLKTFQLLIGFTDGLDRTRKHKSKTGELLIQIPLG